MNGDGFRISGSPLWAVLLLSVCAGSAFGQYRTYWGDVHGHTALSDGEGTPDDYFTHARDVAKLDFVILTDHDFGNGRPGWRMPKESWALIQERADQYNADGRFVAIGGYEWTSQEKYWAGFTNGHSERLFAGPPKHYNHKNVYFTNRIDYIFSSKDSASKGPDLLAEAVARVGGLIHNNHPDALEPGLNQFDYIPAHAAVIPNTEIYPDIVLYRGKSYPARGEETVRGFLDRGGRTGIVAGTDTHDGRPDARTAVLARELTRDAIFDALRDRRNYAINHARIGVDFRINGEVMGSEIESVGVPRIAVDVRGTDIIEEVAIVRDGKVLRAMQPRARDFHFEETDANFPGESYYYVRVIQADRDEHGNRSHAWSSPIWVRRRR